MQEALRPGIAPGRRSPRLLAKIGQGGMGTVWRAHDELLDADSLADVLRHSGTLASRTATSSLPMSCARAGLRPAPGPASDLCSLGATLYCAVFSALCKAQRRDVVFR